MDAASSALRILVITVVHDPDDARIRFRELSALMVSGATVTYAAPFAAYGRQPPEGVRGIDLPRATGRHRLAALRAARRTLHSEGPEHDIVLLHDPELLLAVPGLRRAHGDHRLQADRRKHRPLVVWDVHEDTAAAMTMKGYLPRALMPLAQFGVRAMERWAERNCALLLAEESYHGRFRRPHPVVPNSVIVPGEQPPEPGTDRVVYLGRLTRPRGALDMIEVARRLPPDVRMELIGPADPDVAPDVARAHRDGVLVHHGFIPNREALRMLSGALAGLSLLHDEPNYATSRPTKVMEYMAFGVPVVTTPNPASADLVRRYGSGIVVPFGDPGAAVSAILELRDDLDRRRQFGAAGRVAAVRDLDWNSDGQRFGELLRGWAMAGQA
jgi:glycosyltransferase involved in cell wall biosynthesis